MSTVESAPAISRPFAHLHCHTHYSLLDGANRVPDLVKQVKNLGMNSCAITDHGNLYGALEFYQTCRNNGVNPILGYEAYMAPGHRSDRSATRMKEAAFHLTLLAMNRTGFQNLVKMASHAYLEGFYYKPRIDKELLKDHSEGIICLSGCASSELSRLLLADNNDKAKELVHWYSDLFGDRFYLEIQDAGVEIQQSCAEATIVLANQMGLPLVATNDAHYLCQSDAAMHDVLLCVNTKSFRSDEKRMRIGTDQLFLRSPEQMYSAFPNLADAVARSQEIADRCDIQLDLKTRHFPVFTPPGKKTDVEYLREVAEQGLRERYGDEPAEVYQNRLNFELGVIERMGFASYFLIVWDFARFARSQGIPCTARGSACGAIVSYVLGISDVCPIKYDLLFERFLDPSRSEAPDIDMDFCRDRREMVLNYVKEKYGHANVAQIGTFGTLKAKAAIRDVARALSIPLKRADEIAKMVPETLNIKLKDALKESAELKEQYDSDPQVKELITFAIALEGLAKSAGTHAAGVVIADRPLQEYVPLQRISGKEDVLTQWTEVEKAGLLKMDFLGLRNLSILDKAVKNVRKHRGVEIIPKDLPLDDAETFALLQRGETKGIFQLESGGMRDLLTKMKPDQFADIIATSALYRPGPLEGGMVMTYVNVKNGREPTPLVHPIVDEVLAETYGVMVYQEQVMRILNRLGGIELASSYKCIKAISKKNHEIMKGYHEKFIEGAQTQNMPKEQAQDIWDLIEKFAGYGFNKSHSTAYGAIAYQTAYLKAHYPEEFMAALLSCGMESSDRIFEHTDDCRRMKIEVLPPDVNRSEVEFGVIVMEEPIEEAPEAAKGANGKSSKGGRGKAKNAPSDSNGEAVATKTVRKLSFGLGAIKGVGSTAMQAIVDERLANGPFKNIFDLCERVDPKHLTKAVLETLLKAGALDSFGPNRAQHLLVIDRAVQGAAARQRDKARGQKSLFGEAESSGGDDAAVDFAMPPADDWTHGQKLAFEKEVFGFYLTSHPLTEHADQVQSFTQHRVKDLRDLEDGKDVLLGGMISAIKKATTKNPSRNGNSKYVNFDLEDATGVVRCILWPDDFANEGEKVQQDGIVIVRGRIDSRGREPNIIVNKLLTLADAEKEFTKQIVLFLKRGYHSEDEMKRARETLSRFPGKTPVVVVVDTVDSSPSSSGVAAGDESSEAAELAEPIVKTSRLRAILSTSVQVAARPELKQELQSILGPDACRFQAAMPSGGGSSN
ncbi:DNA polymerase III subunit alpha [Planctomicrobium sp. SH661]|uniref:DNA polymerase III subunit alpha n=1 Tax=Planctomicrobium sp. SH661 TaxID=3448124 RepID=UPI003F5C06AC